MLPPEEEVEGDEAEDDVFVGVWGRRRGKLLGLHFWVVVADVLFIVGDGFVIAKEIVLIGVDLNKIISLLLPARAGSVYRIICKVSWLFPVRA